MNKIKLSHIPDAVLPLINKTGEVYAWYNGKIINEIFLYPGTNPCCAKYRINTDTGQYRCDDCYIDIY